MYANLVQAQALHISMVLISTNYNAYPPEVRQAAKILANFKERSSFSTIILVTLFSIELVHK